MPLSKIKPVYRIAFLAILVVIPLAFFTMCRPPAEDSRNELDRLLQIPYLNYVSKNGGTEDGTGVVLHDAARSQPGYRLYTIHPLCMAEILDPSGKPVHSWQIQPGQHWANGRLLPNGDYVTTGADAMANGGNHETDFLDDLRYVARLNWRGDVLWKKALPAHHDVDLTPDGGCVTLTFERRIIPEIDPKIETRDDQLTRLDADGNVIESLSLYKLLAARPDLFQFQPVASHLFGGRDLIDLFHSNSIQWIHADDKAGRHPIYGPDNILISSRNQDSVFVINIARKELVWAWGRGIVQAQHDANMLENGNILMFDNGAARTWSRIIEMDPRTGNVVWEYKAAKPEDFYSLSRGSAQRLANGNTLISNSDSGQAFEVTPDGTTVWEFTCPHKSADGQRASMVRMKELDTDFVESLLKQPAEARP